ncbi:MAG: hypothetical protein U0172_10975 [Nitrospiraceae bacterium]
MAAQKHKPTPNPQLTELTKGLLRLHKALLDGERITYERVHGRIETNGAFFQLVLNDAWFAWLRPLSQTIARIDELSEDGAPEAQAELQATLAEVKALLRPTEEGDGFGRQYYEAIQRDPDVSFAHAAVRAQLATI